jgi:hypothetical protein
MPDLLNLNEYEAAARAVLPQMAYEYIAGEPTTN